MSGVPRASAGAPPEPSGPVPAPATDLLTDRIATGLGEEGFAVVPDGVPDDEWQTLAEEARALRRSGSFRPAGVGRGSSFRLDPTIRDDRVHWIDPASPFPGQSAWLARAEALRRELNERLYLGLFGFETHLAAYPPGACYVPHLDAFADARHRVVSLVLYLNAHWRPEDGGALRLHPGAAGSGVVQDVPPRGGTLVALLSGEILHEVLPATRERLSVVGWLTRRS